MKLIITGDEKNLKIIAKENKLRFSKYNLSYQIVEDTDYLKAEPERPFENIEKKKHKKVE